MPKKVSIIFIIATFITIVIMFGIIVFFVVRGNNDKCPKNMLCTPITTMPTKCLTTSSNVSTFPTEVVRRDHRVLSDPLYPPLNRTDAMTFSEVVDKTRTRNFNIHTNDTGDTYRLIGYLTNNDDNVRSWKLMAKKNRNGSSFYMIPTNNNYDMKIPITNDITVGERLRDIYAIPNEITFKNPILAETPYTFTELPKGDFTDDYN